jgi:hypothetical protein
MQTQRVAQRPAPTSGLADALMFVVIAVVERCLAVVWAIVRRPILSVPVAVLAGAGPFGGAEGQRPGRRRREAPPLRT